LNKNKIIILILGIPLVVFGIFIGSTDFLKEDSIPLEADEIHVYVPSDITKANPNILIGGESSWRTVNVSDVAEHVVYIIEGTVLEIGTPIDYLSSKTSFSGNSLLPITIIVDQVHKGQLNSKTFTFYEMGWFYFIDENDPNSSFMPDTIEEIQQIINDKNKTYHFAEDTAQFEVGEKILIHLDANTAQEPYMIDNPENFSLITTYYSSLLDAYSKYQLQTSESDSVDGIAPNAITLAFNLIHPDGILLSSAIDEGQ